MSHVSLRTHAVESKSEAEDEQFYETVEVEVTRVQFQLNSSAKANVISFKTYSSLKRRLVPPLRKTRTVTDFLFQAQTEASRRSSVDHSIQR